jgi:hypothetical protein
MVRGPGDIALVEHNGASRRPFSDMGAETVPLPETNHTWNKSIEQPWTIMSVGCGMVAVEAQMGFLMRRCPPSSRVGSHPATRIRPGETAQEGLVELGP